MRTLTRALRTRTILPLLLSSFSLIISVDASGSTRGKWYPIPNGSAGSSFGWDSLRNDTLVMGGATHMALMRGGAGDTAWVLHWHLGHQARLWLAVPNDTSFAGKRARNVPLPRDVSAPWDSTELFCAGHSHLHDGKLLVVGGTASAEGRPIGSVGSKYTATYDPSTYAWSFRDEMEFGRWYPTSTTLGDGRVLATGGKLSRPITIFGGRQDGGLSQDLRSGAAISPGGTGNTTGSNVVWADDESIIVPNPRAMAREGHTLVHYAGHDRYFIWGGVGQDSTESPVWVSPDTIRVAFGKTLDGGKKWEWTWRYPLPDATCNCKPAARAWHSSTMMNDTLFIFGGLGSNGQSLGDLWMLRGFANDSLHWVRLAQSGPTRHRHAAAIDPGVDPAVPHLIVQGGRNASLVSGEVWITPLPRQGGSTTVNWQSLSLSGGPGSREGHVAVLDPHVTRKPAPNHRRIFFHGGAGSFFTYDSLYILSRPDTGNTWTWRTAAQSNKPRSRWLHAAIYDSEWDYFRLFGGDTTRAGGKKNDLWTFTMGTPDDGTFTWRLEPQENPPEPRSGHAMTEDTKDLFVQKLERFEPSTGSTGAWSAIADPKQVRMYAMMYQLRNGDVFYAGNSQFESPPDDSSYVLDLPGGTWGNKTFSRFFGGSGMLLSRREVAKDTVLKCGGVGSESSDASTFVAHEKTAIASVDSSNGGTTWASSAFTGHAGAPPMAQPDHPAGWQGAHDRRHG